MSDEPRTDVAEDSHNENAEPAVRWSRLRPWLVAAFVVTLLGNVVRVPYYSVGPGPATDVLGLVEVSGVEVHESDGDLLLTTASLSNSTLTIFEYLWTLVDPKLEAFPKERIVPPGSTDAEQDAENFRQMELSKLDAERAAFEALGMPVERIPGARILTVLPGSAAEDKLEPGDRITTIDEKPVDTPDALIRELGRFAPGDEIVVGFVRDGAAKTVHATLKADRDDPEAARLGVTLADAWEFPASVDINTQRIGGPSGGLVFALALAELLGEEDLTRGRTIAVTGLIEIVDGTPLVGQIGGIREKVHGAAEAGAVLFIVPEVNEAEAEAVAPADMVVVGVETFADAMAALRAEDPATLAD